MVSIQNYGIGVNPQNVPNTKILSHSPKLHEEDSYQADVRGQEPEPKNFNVEEKLAEIKKQKRQAMIEKRSELTGISAREYMQNDLTKFLHNPQVQNFLKDFQKQLGIECDFQFKLLKTYDACTNYKGTCVDKDGNELPYSCRITIDDSGNIEIKYTHEKQNENTGETEFENIGSVTIQKQENADGTSYVMTATDSEGVVNSDIVNREEPKVINPYAKSEEQISQHIQQFKNSLGITCDFRFVSATINPDDGSETQYAVSEDGQYAVTVKTNADGSEEIQYEKIGENDSRELLGTFEVYKSEDEENTTIVTGTYADGTKYKDKIIEQEFVIS